MKKKIILWIPGLTDHYIHNHIKKYIPVFNNYEIKELVFSDYDFLNENIKQYSTEDFLLYIKFIDEKIKEINLEKYSEKILYGHSTGGLISILYLKYGQYCNLFDGLILNDPFIDWNLNFLQELILENSKFYPLCWKFKNFLWRYNKFTKYYKKSCTYEIASYLNSFDYITGKKKECYDDGYIAFPKGASQAQKLILSKKNFLEKFPILLLIANGSEFKKKKFVLGQSLNKNETIYLLNLSSNLSYWYIDGTYHDVFFPEDLSTFDVINIRISNFFNNNLKKKYRLKQNPLPKLNELHNKPLFLPNFIMYLLLLIILLRFNDKYTKFFYISNKKKKKVLIR